MQLPALRYLLAVVEAGSFTKAAAHLGVNASTLTRRVAALEDELGLTLLERSRSGVRLTSGGVTVMVEVRRMLAALEAVTKAARCNGVGKAGEFRLGVRMPPVGEPLRTLLARWHSDHPRVALTLYEMSDHDLYTAIEARRLDVALLAGYGAWPNVVTEPLYCERLFAALPIDHPLSDRETVDWSALRNETVLVQDWADSHATREFYASLLGIGVPFHPHPAGKQSVFGLIAAGFGITLATESQSQVLFPGVVFRPIAENNACVQVKLAWAADSEDAVVGRFIAFMRDAARSQGAFGVRSVFSAALKRRDPSP
jgi:DNA-binding transcriptional LysR family regulator